MITAQSTIPELNRFLSNAVSNDVTAIVVPGMEIARMYGIDLERAGLVVSDVPRHANVLLLIGEIPRSMRHYAKTLYNQMPAPKAILSIGTTLFDPLPKPDVSTDFNEQSINQSVKKLQELFSNKAFEKNGIQAEKTKQPTHQGHDMQSMEGMDHESADMGFMSMVMMTENLPKSPDGLPMEWGEVHFGPLFAGLPGGLEATFLLDGDSIAQTEISVESVKRNLEKKWLGSVSNFLHIFSMIDPLTSHTYRILAEEALENAIKKTVDEKTKNQRIILLEKERIINHLNWLASFAMLLHYSDLLEKTEQQLANFSKVQTSADFKSLQKDMQKLKSNIEGNWFLKKRLAGIGKDTSDGSDAWTRLLVRVSEANDSLDVLQSSNNRHPEFISRSHTEMPKLVQHDKKSLSGKAVLQTPRGKAELSIRLQNGKVSTVSFTSASTKKIELIPQLVQNSEVGDALIAIASLNISPWEVAL